MNGFSGLTVQEVQAYATTLSDKSEELREETTNASNELRTLLESNAFKTLVASTELMSKVETLSANCGKFSDGVDVFAKFLIDKVITDFDVLDEETISLQQELDAKINELNSVSELGNGTIDSSQLDFSKISSTAGDAASGDFIQEGNVHKEYWEGELQLVPREDGTIQIVKDGQVMGYTTEEGINIPVEEGVNIPPEETNTQGIHTPSSEGETAAPSIPFPSEGDGTTIGKPGVIIDPDTGRYNTDIGNLSSNHETIPFPQNAELVRPGLATNFDNNAGAFESLVYNSDTNQYDLIKNNGEVYASFPLEDMDKYYFKSN